MTLLLKLLRMNVRLLCLVFSLTIPTFVAAQNLDNLKNQQPLIINGFISTNQIINRQPPGNGNKLIYTGYYTGNINFNFYGLNVPLTFIYTNKQTSFTNPFNQYGLHPSYKWVKGHIGYASMSFSPYTLNGHLFLGAGVEATPPGFIHVSAMYGRLQRAVAYDSTNLQSQPGYQRMGYGLKFSVVKEKDYVDIIMFRAYDIIDAGTFMIDSLKIYPKENSVVSVRVGKTLLKNLVLSAEYATSAMTTDKRAEKNTQEKVLTKPTAWFMTYRNTTISRNALKANLSYTLGNYSIGAGYERIDPDYATLGAYYFTNNLENTTLNLSANFFESKLSVSGNAGLQRDNLDKSKMNNTKRFVGSANASVTPNEKLNFSASYSNFLSYTNVRSTFDYINQTTPYENWDTLNYRQISQNVNLNGNYQLSANKERRNSVSLGINYQVSNDLSGDDRSDKSHFYNINSSYLLGFTPQNLNITASVNFNLNEATNANTSTWGPSLCINKLFYNRTLRSSFTCAYNTSTNNSISNGNIINFRLGGGYVLKKQHNINLNLLYQIRKQKGENIETSSKQSYTVTFGYTYNFNILKQHSDNKSQKETEL
jgi:hypothetical protein